MLDIKALEAAFTRIGEIGKGEIDIEVDGVRVWMRSLTPEEDVEVQRYARGDDEKIDEMDNITLIERFKRATIGYAVVQVGDLDLRGITSIPTGEVLPNGTPVRVPKHEAVRRIADGWSRQATTLLFQQYAELVKRVEEVANSKVKYDTAKINAEIERLESRLADLRRMQVASINTSTTPVANSLLKAEEVLSQTAIHPPPKSNRTSEPMPAPDPAPASIPVPEPEPVTPPPRQRIVPDVAPPVQRTQPQATPPQVPPGASPIPADVRSSVGDFSADDVAAEEARIYEARARRNHRPDVAAEVVNTPPPVTVPHNRTPPHLSARATHESVVSGSLDAATEVEPVGGVDTYRLPSVNVTDRGRGGPNVPPAPVRGGPPGQRVPASAVNQVPGGTPNNPNFRGGSKR